MRLRAIAIGAGLLTMLSGACGRVNYTPVGDRAVAADASAGASCGQPPAPETLALYRMETVSTGLLIDSVGGFDAVISGASVLGPGPDLCGMAWVGQELTYAVIDHDPRLVGDVGSVDFWIRPGPVPTVTAGILVRDARDTVEPGHFAVMYTTAGRLVARIQGPSGEVNLCSNLPLPADEWAHVGINYGAPGFELHVNGTRQRGTGTWRLQTIEWDCTTTGSESFAVGLTGNANPWVIGANAVQSSEGMADNLFGYFLGDIDELRISRARRDFTTL